MEEREPGFTEVQFRTAIHEMFAAQTRILVFAMAVTVVTVAALAFVAGRLG